MMNDNSGFYSSIDSILSTCKVITSTGVILDFKYMVLEFNYYEDIYRPFVSGSIFISDSVNYINLLQFSGNEHIIISLDNPSKGTPLERTFRLYKVSGRRRASDTNENYFLHFCSEEILLNEQFRISKSYNKTEISKVVKSICSDYLKIKEDKLYVEDTVGLRDIIIPAYKPFQALYWLSSLSLSKSTTTVGTTYLFYENKYGFNFESLAGLFQQKVYKTLLYNIKNVNNLDNYKKIDHDRDVNDVIEYQHINNFNTLDNSSHGTFNNKVITVDPLRGKFGEKTFDYEQFSKEAPKLNPSRFTVDNTNRLGETIETTSSVVRYVVSTTGQSDNEYIKNKNVTINDNRVENIQPYRMSQLLLLDSNKMRLLIPGDVNMTVGLIIDFKLPSVSKQTFGEDEFDPYFSGRYLVTGVRHILQQEGKFYSVIEICKDSMTVDRISSDNKSTLLSQIK